MKCHSNGCLSALKSRPSALEENESHSQQGKESFCWRRLLVCCLRRGFNFPLQAFWPAHSACPGGTPISQQRESDQPLIVGWTERLKYCMDSGRSRWTKRKCVAFYSCVLEKRSLVHSLSLSWRHTCCLLLPPLKTYSAQRIKWRIYIAYKVPALHFSWKWVDYSR